MSEKKPWHEVPEADQKEIMVSNMIVGEFLETYKQPDWCEYPDALEGVLGCWSLMSYIIRSKKNCEACEFCKEVY